MNTYAKNKTIAYRTTAKHFGLSYEEVKTAYNKPLSQKSLLEKKASQMVYAILRNYNKTRTETPASKPVKETYMAIESTTKASTQTKDTLIFERPFVSYDSPLYDASYYGLDDDYDSSHDDIDAVYDEEERMYQIYGDISDDDIEEVIADDVTKPIIETTEKIAVSNDTTASTENTKDANWWKYSWTYL